MAHLNHFAYGVITPLLAYALSFLGSLLGLISTRRARDAASPAQRARWLAMAAWAIGGTGIWVMHFMAMIGFTVDGNNVTYDAPITIASFLTAVIVVGIGLFIVGYGRNRWWKVLFGGVFTGLGVAGMHYTGMAAMRSTGPVSYDEQLRLTSVIIAVVAATVALWFTVTIRRPVMTTVAAAIMGVAVCGMHYTGMAALHVHEDGTAAAGGVTPLTFLVPIFVFVLLVLIALAYAMMASPPAEPVTGPSLQERLAAAAPQFGGRNSTSSNSHVNNSHVNNSHVNNSNGHPTNTPAGGSLGGSISLRGRGNRT